MTAVSREQTSIPLPTRRARRRPRVVLYVGRRSVWIQGQAARRLLDRLDVPHLVCGVSRLLTFPVAALDDVLALAQAEDRPTVLADGTGWPTAGRRTHPTNDRPNGGR